MCTFTDNGRTAGYATLVLLLLPWLAGCDSCSGSVDTRGDDVASSGGNGSSAETWVCDRTDAVNADAVTEGNGGTGDGAEAEPTAGGSPEDTTAGSDEDGENGDGENGDGENGDGENGDGENDDDESSSPKTFPLTISTDKKTLVKPNGEPFLMVGDAAWSLVTQLSKEDAVKYLDDRQARGFNTILTEAIEHKFTSHSPPWKNAAGEVPFRDIGDFTTARDAFFDHLAWVIEQARQRGILVLLTPAYLGYQCGDEGWCEKMRANGVSKLQKYGQFLGERLCDLPNLIWVNGGDHTPSTSGKPSQLDLVNAVARGIATGDDCNHLHTAHWTQGTSSSEGPAIPWLDLDAAYGSPQSKQAYGEVLADWGRDREERPLFFLEGIYENEHDTTASAQRAQMYQPLLSGAFGFVFGNSPIWFFGTPGDGNPGWRFSSGPAQSWKKALSSKGARDATHVRELFEPLPWEELRPDMNHEVLVAGHRGDTEDENVVLAATPDKRLAIAYFTSNLTASIDMGQLPGAVTARWYDPTTGTYTEPEKLDDKGTRTFSPPGTNADGDVDWVLVLRGS